MLQWLRRPGRHGRTLHKRQMKSNDSNEQRERYLAAANNILSTSKAHWHSMLHAWKTRSPKFDTPDFKAIRYPADSAPGPAPRIVPELEHLLSAPQTVLRERPKPAARRAPMRRNYSPAQMRRYAKTPVFAIGQLERASAKRQHGIDGLRSVGPNYMYSGGLGTTAPSHHVLRRRKAFRRLAGGPQPPEENDGLQIYLEMLAESWECERA